MKLKGIELQLWFEFGAYVEEVATLEAAAAPVWLAPRAVALPPGGVSVLSQSFCSAASGLNGVDVVGVAAGAAAAAALVVTVAEGAKPSNMDDRALRLVLLVGVVGVVVDAAGVNDRAGVSECPELRLSGRHGLIGVGLSGLATPPLINNSSINDD